MNTVRENDIHLTGHMHPSATSVKVFNVKRENEVDNFYIDLTQCLRRKYFRESLIKFFLHIYSSFFKGYMTKFSLVDFIYLVTDILIPSCSFTAHI